MATSTETDQVRYSISEASVLLDRSPQTLRSWDRNNSMPRHLRPKRDKQNNRYWTPKLIEDIKEWIVENHFHPGRGISYEPTPERLEQHIRRIRRGSARKKDTDSVALLRTAIEDASVKLKMSADDILKHLPTVAADMDVPLGQALRVAGEVLGKT